MPFWIVLSFVRSHCDDSLRLQYMQSPHAIWNDATTRWPGFRLLISSPTLSTTPQNSWPRMSPFSSSMMAPCSRCRSEPHTVLPVTLRMTSRGSMTRGLGTSSTLTVPLPCQTSACMVAPLGSAYFCRSRAGLVTFCSVTAVPPWPMALSTRAAAWESAMVRCCWLSNGSTVHDGGSTNRVQCIQTALCSKEGRQEEEKPIAQEPCHPQKRETGDRRSYFRHTKYPPCIIPRINLVVEGAEAGQPHNADLHMTNGGISRTIPSSPAPQLLHSAIPVY